MNRLKFYFRRLLVILRIRMVAGGLDISDQALRFVHLNGKMWQFSSVRLEPGVLENGEIKDRAKLIATFLALKEESKLGTIGVGKKINIIVSLSSANVYSQVFPLPDLTGGDLKKAAELNLQMASPGEISKMYSGWKVVGKNGATGNLDVLSSFIEKDIVDPMVKSLFEAGFFTVAVEPRALALARVLRERGSGMDIKRTYLLVRIDDSGIEFLVVRNGEPYFEYGSRWSEIAEQNGEIAIPRFQSELVAHLRQVLNFYDKHWTDPIVGMIIASTTLQEEILAAITPNVTFPIIPLSIEVGQPVSSEWLVGLGSSLRGLSQDVVGQTEVNLLGDEWKDQFHEQQAMEFLGFWQVLMPIALAMLVVIFIGFSVFLNSVKSSLASESTLSSSGAAISNSSEAQALAASSTAFNNEVAIIQQIETTNSISPALDAIVIAATSTDVTISHLVLNGGSQTIVLSGFAPSENMILSFKQALSENPHVSDISLPLAGIQANGGNYSFAMTFIYSL